MKRKLISGVIICVILLSALSLSVRTAHAQSAPTLDNHGFQFFVSATALTYSFSLSTTQPNAVIFMIVQMNTASPTGISDSYGLTWNLVSSFGSDGVASLYWAVVPNAETTTVTITTPSPQHFNVLWFDILGANLKQPLDPNPSLPNKAYPTTGPTVPATGSTTYPDDFIFAYDDEVGSCNSMPTINAPFVNLQGALDCGYSLLDWLAYYQTTTVQTDMTWTPFTNNTPNEAFTTVVAIQGAQQSSSTTSTTPTSTTVSTATTTTASSTTISTSTSTLTTVTETTSTTASTTSISTTTASTMTSATMSTLTETCQVVITMSNGKVTGEQIGQCS